MAFAVSGGKLETISSPPSQAPHTLRISDGFVQDYAAIFKAQPAVRSVVMFLARNVAQLGWPLYRRVSDLDRVRETTHPLAKLLAAPNSFTTPFRMKRALVADLAIYDQSLWLKTRENNEAALVRIAPWMFTVGEGSWIRPSSFIIKGNRGSTELPADRFVYLHGYNPTDARVGSSPIESLRRVLAEEFAAGQMREQTLRNGARLSGYISRPKEAAAWSPAAADRFRDSWRSQYAGWSATEAGGTPVLEDGMTFVPAAQSAVDLQYVESRKLTREEVAQAYFVPPPMLGILDNATFSNITEQHKMLYQDTLGPMLTEIEQELMLQLLPEFPDSDNLYIEFNLAEKLKGSFEEQAQQLQTSVGAPYMTRNEARARMNLSQIDGGDELVTPLNVITGGQASPSDSGTQNQRSRELKSSPRRSMKSSDVDDEPFRERAAALLTRFFNRQRAAVLSAAGAKAVGDWWDAKRWDRELTADLYALAVATATQIGKAEAEALGFDPGLYDEDRTLAFLHAVAESRAGAINSTTRAQLIAALEEDEPDLGHVFDVAESSRVESGSAALVAAIAGFAVMETARQLVGRSAVKTWRVQSSNPRSAHALMDGEAVGLDETFSNGAMWPGDPVLGADGVAGCMCGLDIDF